MAFYNISDKQVGNLCEKIFRYMFILAIVSFAAGVFSGWILWG